MLILYLCYVIICELYDNNYVWCVLGYVWDRIREGCTKRNVTIVIRYVHEMLRLDYIPECYG